MGNFIQNLAKGFIRSAVNQVGRDGGKIISNQIYGDAHSTPYRNTSSQYTNNEEVIYKEVSPDEVREKAIKDGYTPVYSQTHWIVKILYFIFSTFWLAILFKGLPILAAIPSVILLCKGVSKIIDKNEIKMQKIASVAVYKPDRRYKNGERLVGYTNKKLEIKVKSSEEEAKEKQAVGNSYVIMAVISIIIGIVYNT